MRLRLVSVLSIRMIEIVRISAAPLGASKRSPSISVIFISQDAGCVYHARVIITSERCEMISGKIMILL